MSFFKCQQNLAIETFPPSATWTQISRQFEEPLDRLAGYGEIPIRFEVRTLFEIKGGDPNSAMAWNNNATRSTSPDHTPLQSHATLRICHYLLHQIQCFTLYRKIMKNTRAVEHNGHRTDNIIWFTFISIQNDKPLVVTPGDES